MTSEKQRAAIFIIGFAMSIFSNGANGEVIVAGNDSSVASGSFSFAWDNSQHAELRQALENTANFGPLGIVNVEIDTVDLTSITTASLSGIDIFVSSFWQESDSGPFESLLRDFFFSGGSLLLLQDGVDSDGVGSLLGIETIADPNNPTTPALALANGAFGSVDPFNGAGMTGHLDPLGITSNNGTICGSDSAGNPTIACWRPDEFAPGAGSLVIMSDSDYISGEVGGADYDPPNNKGRLGLNTFEFLTASQTAQIPAPAPVMIFGGGLIGLGLAARRRRKH